MLRFRQCVRLLAAPKKGGGGGARAPARKLGAAEKTKPEEIRLFAGQEPTKLPTDEEVPQWARDLFEAEFGDDATPRMSASDEPGLSTEPTRASIKSARKAAIKSRNAELAK
eukprot:TRINITY_DN10233_c0_g1_i1.p2 TRINITY_DN10233_c0_g1~~TRINITY_DN10233_c0_g1_i1.p2  ORF type:complete len:120 (-),score=52.83 TRINITY_DN10233_c0_g1_i1:133-468(-)